MFCHRFYHCPQTQKTIAGRTLEKWLENRINPRTATSEKRDWFDIGHSYG